MVKKAKLNIEEKLNTTSTETYCGDENTHHHTNDLGYIKIEHLQEIIAEAAYFKAEQRNFEPGYEMDDWLAAEADICRLTY
jgi:hypothetical protein